MAEVTAEFHAALATAHHALEQFNREPTVDSKRGGPRLSPWWRVYVQASEVAARWNRQLQREPEPEMDDLIDRLLDPRWDRGCQEGQRDGQGE